MDARSLSDVLNLEPQWLRMMMLMMMTMTMTTATTMMMMRIRFDHPSVRSVMLLLTYQLL